MEMRGADRARIASAMAELDAAGWGAVWIAGANGPGLWDDADALLSSTRRIAVAFGVMSIWGPDAVDPGVRRARLVAAHGDRLVTGLGVSNARAAASAGRIFGSPVAAMTAYLDHLDASVPTVGAGSRILAALGPRMVALAGARAAGVHPFLITPEWNVAAREALGSGPLIAAHQAVVLETDATRARAIARRGVGMYLGFPSYQANLRRLGFAEEDLLGGGSDRLIDAVVAWGTPEVIAERIGAHRAAGADHVALHVLTAHGRLPTSEWRELQPLAVADGTAQGRPGTT
jgi:probable F420-dependent oxidoreductase